MRVGKWDEQKIRFKGRNQGGHDHFGGTRGAHIAAGALATGAVNVKALGTGAMQYVHRPSGTAGIATTIAKRMFYFGTLTKRTTAVGTVATFTFGGATGFTKIDWFKVSTRYGRGTYTRFDTGTTMFYNYYARASMLYLFLTATLGIGGPVGVQPRHVWVEAVGR